MHVAAEEEGVGEATEGAERGGEGEGVDHEGACGGGREFVGVGEGGEGTAYLLVYEAVWWVEVGDAGGEALADAEVAGFPGDGVAEFHGVVRGGDGDAFAGVGHGLGVDGGVAGEIEANVGWGGDRGEEADGGHGIWLSLRRCDGRPPPACGYPAAWGG